MNLITASVGKNALSSRSAGSIFAGNLPVLHNSALKSTQEKAERQQKASNEIAFWEKQKENLKDRECDTVEEIAQKLNAFHSYEDQIAAVKTAYNNEQMSHILDEAQEQGEKNAEAAKKLEPKTPEERREEMVEEALGTEEKEGILDEMLDEVLEAAEEVMEEQEEVLEGQEEMLEEAKELALEEAAQGIQGESQRQKELFQGEAIQGIQGESQRQEELFQEEAAQGIQGESQRQEEPFGEPPLAPWEQRNAALELYNKNQAAEREKYRKGLDFRA